MESILQYLELSACRCPDKTALSDGQGKLSYQQLYDQARGIGSTLMGKGITKKRIVVWLRSKPRAVAALLGGIYSGSIVALIDDSTPGYQIPLIFQAMKPAAVISDPAVKQALTEMGFHGIWLSYEAAAFRIIDEPALMTMGRRRRDTDYIYACFQEDSHSFKLLPERHRDVILYAELQSRQRPLAEGTRFYCHAPWGTGACYREILSAIKQGASVCFPLIKRVSPHGSAYHSSAALSLSGLPRQHICI